MSFQIWADSSSDGGGGTLLWALEDWKQESHAVHDALTRPAHIPVTVHVPRQRRVDHACAKAHTVVWGRDHVMWGTLDGFLGSQPLARGPLVQQKVHA